MKTSDLYKPERGKIVNEEESFNIEKLVNKGRNETAILDLQRRKLEARDRLRLARAEMRRLDADLISVGANGLDLAVACW